MVSAIRKPKVLATSSNARPHHLILFPVDLGPIVTSHYVNLIHATWMPNNLPKAIHMMMRLVYINNCPGKTRFDVTFMPVIKNMNVIRDI